MVVFTQTKRVRYICTKNAQRPNSDSKNAQITSFAQKRYFCTKNAQKFTSLKKLYRQINHIKSHFRFFIFFVFQIPPKQVFFLIKKMFLIIHVELIKYQKFILVKTKYFDIMMFFSKTDLFWYIYSISIL